MDPELIAAIREYMVKTARLRDTGVEVTPAQIEEFFRAKTGGKYGYTDAQRVIGNIDTSISPRNLGRSAVQGATFNFGDELLGLVDKGAGEEMKLRDELFRKQHPVAAGAANVAGGLAVPGLGAAKVAGGATSALRAALSGGAIGAASGALAGAGEAEGGLAERASAAVVPGLVGGGLGAALPGVLGGLRAAFSPSARAAARLEAAVRRSGGAGAVAGRAAAFEQAGRGQEAMLGDLTTPLRQASDFAANASDQAAEALGKPAFGRQADASERILGDLKQVVGDPQAKQIVSDLELGTRAWARGPEGYGGLGEANPTLPPEAVQQIEGILGNPAVTRAWDQAAEVGLIGPRPPAGPVSFEVLQGTKERLDAAADGAFNRGMGDLGARLGDARDELVAQMRAVVPGYQEVAAEYAKRKGLERAVQAGQDAMRNADSRGLAAQVGAMTPEELERFRQGMTSELITQLRSVGTNRDLAKKLVDASPAMEEKLQVVFGSQQAFEQFMAKMEFEQELAKMISGPLSGSQTARRLATQAADPAAMAIDAATGGPVGAAIGAARSALPKIMSSKTAAEMGPILATQGTTAIERLMQRWGMRPPMVGGMGAQALPVGLGIGAGSLLGE